ncbi:MAG: hypothetical protein ABSF89_02590 [Acidimicrobiales bacterium]
MACQLVEKQGIPGLSWIEAELHQLLRESEPDYVPRLVRETEAGTLEGFGCCQDAHGHAGDIVAPPPLFLDDPAEH